MKVQSWAKPSIPISSPARNFPEGWTEAARQESMTNEIATEARPKRGMSRTQKILFFATGWLIVLMPFLFWWNTWFGRHLSDQQVTVYLHDNKKPRHIQQALVQVGDRMSH